MNRREEIKRDLRRFRQGKPFYSPTEEVPPRLTKKLQNRDWNYKVQGSPGPLGGSGGHWIPPNWKSAKKTWT